MHAIRTTQTIVHREALARDEAMAEVVSKLRCIVRMDGLYDRFQAAHAWLVHIRNLTAGKFTHAFAEENGLTVGGHPPEGTGREPVGHQVTNANPVSRFLSEKNNQETS